MTDATDSEAVGAIGVSPDPAIFGSVSLANLLWTDVATFQGAYPGLSRAAPLTPWVAIDNSPTGGTTIKLRRPGTYLAECLIAFDNPAGLGGVPVLGATLDASLVTRAGGAFVDPSGNPTESIAADHGLSAVAAVRTVLKLSTAFSVTQAQAGNAALGNLRFLVIDDQPAPIPGAGIAAGFVAMRYRVTRIGRLR